MKKQLLKPLIIFSLFITLELISQNPSSTSNLVTNGRFEGWNIWHNYPDVWTISGGPSYCQSNDDDQEGGTLSLQLEIKPSENSYYLKSHNITLYEGVTYLCTFYYKSVSGSFQKISYDLRRSNDNTLLNNGINEFTEFSTSIWEKGQFEFIATETETINVYIYTFGTSSSKMLIDNVSLFDSSGLSTTEYSNEKNKLIVYPSPAKEYIKIKGFLNEEKYDIYNIIGRKIITGCSKENEKIDISSLTKGIYILKTEKGRIIKFIKK